MYARAYERLRCIMFLKKKHGIVIFTRLHIGKVSRETFVLEIFLTLPFLYLWKIITDFSNPLVAWIPIGRLQQLQRKRKRNTRKTYPQNQRKPSRVPPALSPFSSLAGGEFKLRCSQLGYLPLPRNLRAPVFHRNPPNSWYIFEILFCFFRHENVWTVNFSRVSVGQRWRARRRMQKQRPAAAPAARSARGGLQRSWINSTALRRASRVSLFPFVYSCAPASLIA